MEELDLLSGHKRIGPDNLANMTVKDGALYWRNELIVCKARLSGWTILSIALTSMVTVLVTLFGLAASIDTVSKNLCAHHVALACRIAGQPAPQQVSPQTTPPATK